MTDHRRHTVKRKTDAKAPATWTFFRQWLKNPLGVAAFSPSSRHLAKQMIAELPRDAARIVELGGGTGVFTRALIAHGIAPKNLMVLELNEAFYQLLRENFPGAHVVCGDACELKSVAKQAGYLEGGLADAVLSGLGLLSMARKTQRAILESAFSILKPEGRLIQFTYAPTSPVPRELVHELGLSVRRAGFSLWNIPPASVYVFTRSRSKAIHAVRAGAKA
jgi:phosphatidylethanolamine/phosphatidyl-N-methylethanolamine N-methyltransferase